MQLAPIQTISISNSALTKTSNSLFKLETMPRTYWYWTVPPTTRLPRAAPNSGLIDSMRLDWTSSDATVSARSGCFRPTLALSQRSTPQIFYFRNRICPAGVACLGGTTAVAAARIFNAGNNRWTDRAGDAINEKYLVGSFEKVPTEIYTVTSPTRKLNTPRDFNYFRRKWTNSWQHPRDHLA